MMDVKMELRGRRKRGRSWGRFDVVEEDMKTVGVTE